MSSIIAVMASQRLMSQKDRGNCIFLFLNDSVIDFDRLIVSRELFFFDDNRLASSSAHCDCNGAAKRTADGTAYV